ncbi:MAG: hypothetical protein RL062_1243 [Bacteroidota bacterium]
MKGKFLVILFCGMALWSMSQEFEHPLSRIEMKRNDAKTGNRILLELPFFDDFSYGRSATQWPATDRWINSGAYVSNQMPIEPLTLGAAVLDGLNADGIPYDFTDQYAQGPADTLTSQPLNLDGKDSLDNVYLFFYYQAAGWGNMPDDIDSLYIDFYSPLTQNWTHVKSLVSDNTTEWKRCDVHIKYDQYLMSGFQFRFRNDATLSGAYDQWNLDYVNVQEGMDTANYQFNEVAMQYTPSGILNNGYTTMPWKHFIAEPTVYLTDTLRAYERNLGPTENIVTGYSLTVNGSKQVFNTQNLNTFNNDYREIETKLLWNNAAIANAALSDSLVNVEVCTFINQADPHLENDTACVAVTFSNYYAYDDGGAERSWTVQGAGSQVAMKFYNYADDTLVGIAVNWIPYGVDHSDQNFFLRVWSDNGGVPGDVISDNYNYQSPAYDDQGYTQFHFHAFDVPLALPTGTYYVGWVQSDPQTYDVGNDKNTNNNPAKLFYSLGSGQSWEQSQVVGSVMIRPYLKAGEKQVWDNVQEHAMEQGVLFPNPAYNNIQIQTRFFNGFRWKIMDGQGQLIQSGKSFQSTEHWDISAFNAGLYIIWIEADGQTQTYRWIKQ